MKTRLKNWKTRFKNRQNRLRSSTQKKQQRRTTLISCLIRQASSTSVSWRVKLKSWWTRHPVWSANYLNEK